MTRPLPRSPARQVRCICVFCPPPLSHSGPSFPCPCSHPFTIPCWPLIIIGGPPWFPSPLLAFLDHAHLFCPLLCGAGLPCPHHSCCLCHHPCSSQSHCSHSHSHCLLFVPTIAFVPVIAIGPVVVVVFLVLFIHCLCWAFPVLRGAGVVSRQVAAFGILTPLSWPPSTGLNSK